MRLPVPLSASIALHGAALAFISITPYVASLPPRTLEVTINKLLPDLHDPVRFAPTTHVAGPRHDAEPGSAVAVSVSEIAVLAASVNPTPAPMAPGEPSRVSVAATGATVPPRFDAAYLDNPEPAYPVIARRRGLEGLVLLEVTVDLQGHPAKIRVADGSGEDSLDQAAVDAVQGWRFVPAMRGNEPVEGRVRVPIRFRLSRR